MLLVQKVRQQQSKEIVIHLKPYHFLTWYLLLDLHFTEGLENLCFIILLFSLIFIPSLKKYPCPPQSMSEAKAQGSMRGCVINVSSECSQSCYPLTLLQSCVNGNGFSKQFALTDICTLNMDKEYLSPSRMFFFLNL